jgi:hypothetical protein
MCDIKKEKELPVATAQFDGDDSSVGTVTQNMAAQLIHSLTNS